jgi:hypothetical protein
VADQIIVEYGARIDKLEKELKDIEKGMRGVDEAAKKSSDNVVKSFKNVEKESNNLNNTLKKVGGAIAGYFTVSTLLNYAKHVRDVTAEFQKLEAVLTNTLGDSSLAQKALLDIQEFAAVTPYGVTELTQAFVKLANSGFKPTISELRKLGDLASSTGKSFDQLAEAIIDAQTGEFERLKEFGIRASKEGDKVTFAFKNVKTQVDFTSEAIQNYLLSLGEVEGVSGAMEAISKTLGGQLSNLDDEFDQLAKTIGGQASNGFSNFISLVSDAVRVIREFQENDFQTSQREYNTAANELLKTYEDWGKLPIADQMANVTAEIARLREETDKLDVSFDRNNSTIVSAKENASLLDKGLSSLGFTTTSSQKTVEEYTKKNDDLRKTINANLIVIGQLEERYKSLVEKSKPVVKSQEEIDKEFKKQLDTLKALEDIAVRRVKLEDGTEGQIVKVHEDFNQRRINLYKRYAKTQEVEYQSLKLREEELEKEFTKFLENEEKNRAKKRNEDIAGIKNTRFKALEDLKKQEENLSKELQLVELQQIGTERKAVENLQKQFQRDDLLAEIQHLESKMQLQKLYGDSTLDTEREILEAKEKLYQLDVDAANKAEDDKRKKREENAKKLVQVADLAQKGVEAYNDVELAKIQAKYDAEREQIQRTADFQTASIEKQLRANLISEEVAATQKERIRQEAARRESALKRQQFISDRNAKLTQIGIETAFGIIKAVASSPLTYGMPFAAFVAAQGAIEAAVVRSQPIPKFEKGGAVKGKRHSEGGVIAELEGGEFVHNRKSVRKHANAITAIHEDKFDKFVAKKYVAPALRRAKAEKEAFEMRRQSTAENILKSLAHNGVDLSYLESITRKNNSVSIKNADYLADQIARKTKKGGIRK